MAAYRSDFLHAWVVGIDPAANWTPAEVESSLADLEHEVLHLPEGVVPPPLAALPNEAHHALSGLQFLREWLWPGQPAVFGLLFHGGRVWALKSGVDAEVEQLTGAPSRVRWHEWEGGLPLAWCELGAAEVWRLSAQTPHGALHAHYRPALVPIAPPGFDDDLTFSVRPATEPSQTRQARRRRQRREAHRPPTAQTSPAPVPEQAPGQDTGLAPAEPEPEVGPGAAPPDPATADAAPPALISAPDVAPTVTASGVAAAPIVAEPAVAEPGLTEPVLVPPPESAPSQPSHPSRPSQPAPPSRPRVATLPPAPPRVPAARPRPPVAWGGHAWRVGALALVALVALAAALAWGRKPLATLVVGRYSVDLTSDPRGATVRLDGKPVAGRTPLTLALTPGEHRVDLEYGEYASASFNLDGERGDHVSRSATWTGSLGVASADTSIRLNVAFDGQSWGATPLWRDSVPVGRHRLSFRAPGVRAWDEEVQIHSGQSTRVSAEPVRVPPYGLVTARAELVSSDGVEDLEGLPVFVDGERNGSTPVDLKLDAGPHSVKIARGADAPSVHLIDVQAGGRYYATAQFGRPPDPLVDFEAPASISRTKPPTLAIRLAADLPLPVRQVLLYVKGENGRFDRVPAELSQSNGRALGTVSFPAADLASPTLRAVTYYVEVETREGEEYFSELRTAPLAP